MVQILLLLLIGSAIMLSLGMIGYYLAKIYEEVKRRPRYIVSQIVRGNKDVTDSVRDVKSLSGGESFMAALSMALGLADIIQNTAGAVSLETMFVDEGFGSLDDASRDRAIQILKELAGEKGLVGIISHVNELKEQIDWKLNITKTEHGSQAKWEI